MHPNFKKSGRTSFKMIVDGWHFYLDCFVADNFVAGLFEENYISLFLSLSVSLSVCLSLSLLPMKSVLICFKIGIWQNGNK